jgi:hypothetical protein
MEGKTELIERLHDIRHDATEAMKGAAHDLSVRRGEFDVIMQGRSRLAQRFSEHPAPAMRYLRSTVKRTARCVARPGNSTHETPVYLNVTLREVNADGKESKGPRTGSGVYCCGRRVGRSDSDLVYGFLGTGVQLPGTTMVTAASAERAGASVVPTVRP